MNESSWRWRMALLLRRMPGAGVLLRRIFANDPVGKTQLDLWDRSHYAFGVSEACKLASALGLPGITAIEFGVAGGNGLVSLERIAADLAKEYAVQIDVYGFDAGSGMPSPVDYRDVTHVWDHGFYQMDVERLRARLKSAHLVLGDVAVTCPETLPQLRFPVGFISFDLDYYSSTKAAFSVFGGSADGHLPRTFCYFDDVILPLRACHNEYIGELLAIREFNEEQPSKKITKLLGLSALRAAKNQVWHEQFFVMHDFSHPKYAALITEDSKAARQLPLDD